jgi:hypothetical protein
MLTRIWACWLAAGLVLVVLAWLDAVPWGVANLVIFGGNGIYGAVGIVDYLRRLGRGEALYYPPAPDTAARDDPGSGGTN